MGELKVVPPCFIITSSSPGVRSRLPFCCRNRLGFLNGGSCSLAMKTEGSLLLMDSFLGSLKTVFDKVLL